MVDIFALILSYSSSILLVISTCVLLFFWKDYYFIYHHRLLFVIGLVFSRYLTDYVITSVLTWYFASNGGHLFISFIMTTVQSSSSSLLMIAMADIALKYGRFYILLFSNTAYIGGLILLWMFNPYDVDWLVAISLGLLSIETSGHYVLRAVLIDLVDDVDRPHEDKTKARSLARAEMWSRIAYTCSAIATILWVTPDAVGGVHPSWNTSFLICLILMITTSIIFCGGHNSYHPGRLTRRRGQELFREFDERIKKFLKYNSRYFKKYSTRDRSRKNLLTENNANEGIPLERRQLRLDAKGKEAKQEDMKLLSRMLPMWVTLFVVSMISATGYTFFFQQYSNLNVSKKIPVQIYNIVQDFSRFALPLLFSTCLQEYEKFKIGVGMLCGILSCIFAWQLEIYRLREVEHLVDKDLNTSISFLWLVPQFCALGCMEGLTWDGVLKFYNSQLEEPLLSYGEEYIEVVMGLGGMINMFLVVILNSHVGWFGDTINDSRLDKYYLVLVYVSSANFIFYFCIARYFYKDQVLVNDDHKQDDQVVVANGDLLQDYKTNT